MTSYSNLKTGKCVMFDVVKGYGFIKMETGSDIFVHASNVEPTGRFHYRSIFVGKTVWFNEIIQDDGRRRAINVTISDPTTQQFVKNNIYNSLLISGYLRRKFTKSNNISSFTEELIKLIAQLKGYSVHFKLNRNKLCDIEKTVFTKKSAAFGPKFYFNNMEFQLALKYRLWGKGAAVAPFELKIGTESFPLNISTFDMRLKISHFTKHEIIEYPFNGRGRGQGRKRNYHLHNEYKSNEITRETKFHFNGITYDFIHFDGILNQCGKPDYMIDINTLSDCEENDIYFEINEFNPKYCHMYVNTKGLCWNLNKNELQLLRDHVKIARDDIGRINNRILKAFEHWKFELRMDRYGQHLNLIVWTRSASTPSYNIGCLTVKYDLEIKYDNKCIAFRNQERKFGINRRDGELNTYISHCLQSSTIAQMYQLSITLDIEIIDVEEKRMYDRYQSNPKWRHTNRKIPKQYWHQYGIIDKQSFYCY
eukprot:391399_1